MKDMVNNFCRENVAKLTFGDISSELQSAGYPSAEISFAFTPTTLAALESTFVSFGESVGVERVMESDSSSAQVNWDQSTSYSGMSECSNDSEDNSNSMDWTAGGKRSRKCDSSGESTQMMGDSRPPRRLPGPRPSCRDEEMTPEELERRRRRRERNKTAAAKCRQRRVDQTNVLLQETKGLEEEAQKLEKEIKALEQLKHQLEFVLDAHKPVCKADVNASFFKTEPQSIPTSIPASRPTSLPIATTTAPQVISNTISTSAANQLFFDFPSTGLTPLADPMFFGSLEGASPSLFLLSPSSLLAQ